MTEIDKSVFYSDSGDREQDEILLQPFTYIAQIPGKQVRVKLIQALNYWLKIPDDKLYRINDVIQLLHNSSLLIDDVEDNSVLRRGVPAAHSVYGIASTINSAHYVFFIALERVISLKHPEAAQIYNEQLLELHRGQGMDIYWRDNYICPTESEYKNMILKKTGGLMSLAARLMQLFSTYKEDLLPLIEIVGLYFQIRDDYCNLWLKEYSDNKTYCEDLSEGKFSFPIIHAIQNYPEDVQIINILKKRTQKNEVKRYCVSLLEKFGSFNYTRKMLEELDMQARTEIKRLGGNPHMIKILDGLLNWKHIEMS